MVSLDKALETNHLSARVGDNVEIKCDVTGTPSPPIIWKRYSTDLTMLSEDEVIYVDLIITKDDDYLLVSRYEYLMMEAYISLESNL